MPTPMREAVRWLKRRRLARRLELARGEEIKQRNADLNWREFWHGCTRLRSYPRHIQVGTNWTCNLRCTFCRLPHGDMREQVRSLPAEGREISAVVLDRVLDVMPYPEMLTLAPLGEPLLYSKLGRMLERHRELGCHNLAITTNANLIDDERARMIVEAGVCHLYVSVDACDATLYAQMRVGGSLEKAEAALESINRWKERLQSPLPTMTLASTFMERNVRQMPDLLEFAIRYRFQTYSVQLMEVVNRELEAEFLGRHIDITREMVRETQQRAEGRAIDVRFHLALRNLLSSSPDQATCVPGLSDDVHDESPPSDVLPDSVSTRGSTLIEKCHDPWGYLLINTDGDCHPCCWAAISFGNFNQLGFDEIWNSEAAVRMRRDFLRNHIPKACQSKFCRVDLGHTGTLEE